jgi:hypothetical protein
MVQRQTSLIEEQNRRLIDLEQTRPSVRAKQTPSPLRSRRGGSPRRSRSRSPRHSVSIRSPSYTRRSTRRRSPRRSPPRRSPPMRTPPRRTHPRRTPLEDLRPGATGALGHLLVSRTLVIPELFVTLTVRSHGVSGKLLSPGNWRSLHKWTRMTGQLTQTSTSRT